jgi:hypothetical protein
MEKQMTIGPRVDAEARMHASEMSFLHELAMSCLEKHADSPDDADGVKDAFGVFSTAVCERYKAEYAGDVALYDDLEEYRQKAEVDL